jgi:hypothetical protein
METRCDLETFFGTNSSNMFGWDFSAGARRYSGPANIYYGSADPFINESLSLPGYFRNAELGVIEFEGCGHYWEECADAFFLEGAHFLADALR